MLKSLTITLPGDTPSLPRTRVRTPSTAGRAAESFPATSVTSEAKSEYVTGVRRAAYLVLGSGFVVLAILGVVLPGLPTTPFLLLASYFLSRSWPRLHQALINNRIFGPILRDWQTHRGVTQRTKNQARLMICVAMLFLGLSGLPPMWISLLLPLTLIGFVVVHRLPTIVRKAS